MPWSTETRARQRQAIQRWRPWEQSRGVKTFEGKARAAAAGSAGYQGDIHGKLRAVAKALRAQEKALLELCAELGMPTASLRRNRKR